MITQGCDSGGRGIEMYPVIAYTPGVQGTEPEHTKVTHPAG
jgi:hypothetical protein